MIYAIFIAVYFIMMIATMVFHIKTTSHLRDKISELRNSNTRYSNDLSRVREEYHQFQLNRLQWNGGGVRFGTVNDPNEPYHTSEDTARVALLKLYHIAKTDPKGLSLRSAVLHWNRKHNKPMNEGE